ncbi:MAG: phage minor capsid protein [Ruminococcus sp.]|nr:phage minor capsid protein [Ruminococcus sp.]
MNAEKSDCDIMEITAHADARHEHAKWQGQLVSLSGKNAGRTINGKKVLTLRQIGYGKGDGFGGWGCRHDWYPFFEGYSRPLYDKSDLDTLDEKNIEYNGRKYSQYEISQIQRRYEREIRASKREQVAFRTAVQEADDPELKQVMQDSLNYADDIVKQKQAKMRDFIKQTGQFRDYSREQNYGKVSYNYSHSDSDFSGKIKNVLTGKKYMNVVNDFAESLPNIENKKVFSILEKAYNNVTFEKSQRKNSYFNSDENKVYIAKGATPSTIAHELFHKTDHDNKITGSGLLDKCIDLDYKNLKNNAEKAGLSLEDMLYLKYPEAFEKKGRMKEEYRGFSDIINGMTKGNVKLSYGHNKDGYWDKPLKLQKETFAQYGRFYYENNPDVMKLVNEMLPEISKQIEKIINVIFQFGG